MKKIMMLFFAIMFIFTAKDVFAQDQYKLTLEKQDGIFMSRTGVSYGHDSYPFYIYKMNDLFAYCIEPGKHITTYNYIGTSDYVDLPFSEEIKEKLELIGYYGRDYPGHNNIRYSMATQALIWELTGVDKVSFWTKLNEEGQEIDVSYEKNEIMNLVNNHKSLPNFKTSYQAYLNKELIINDSNKLLNEFEIVDDGTLDVSISNNSLHIIPKKIGDYKIKLKRKNYDFYNTIIFVGKEDGSSQKLARFRYSKEITTELDIKVNGISIVINKKDDSNNPIKIANIKFKIKDISKNHYICEQSSCTYYTNSDGIIITNPLDYGEYEIEEVESQIIDGYTWNSGKIHVTLNENTNYQYNEHYHNYVEVNFINNRVKFSVEVTKYGENPLFKNNEITYEKTNLANIYFDLYTTDNKYIATTITNDKGIARIDNLAIGKYYLVERNTDNRYIVKDKIPFMIRQTTQYQETVVVHVNVSNSLKKGRLEFSKVDDKTNKGIANTIIEIYDEKDKLLFTKETDINGQITIDNLPAGKYYITEKVANYYYEKSNERINFEIKENNEIVKKIMTNKKLLGKVELEKNGERLDITNNEIKYLTIPLANIEFDLYKENGEFIETLKTNEKGVIVKELELGKYYLLEKTKLLNYKDNNEKYFFEIKKENNRVVNSILKINNYLKKGGVFFSKEELVTYHGISNTLMEIYNDQSELILTRKTDSEGKIIINNLPLGKYYFKEKEANYFFQITDELVPFEIKQDGEVVKARLTNEKIVGNLEINKLSENYHFINNNIVYENETLHGIEFEIYDSTDNLVGSMITDKNGYAKYSNLSLGKYYLIEKTKLDKYNDGDKYYFEIKKKDDTKAFDVKLDILNKLKKGNLIFSKIDLVTSEGIPNTIIEIYNDKDMLIFTKETDSHGQVIINDLPMGSYYIIEKVANYNYEKSSEKISFEIKDNGEIVKAQMTNKKILGNLEIEKYGEDYHITDGEMIYEKKKLPDIEFAIYDERDNLIIIVKTDNNGYANYSKLPLGKYYIVEKTNLDNYVMNNNKNYFEIKKDNNKAIPIKLNINNYIKKGTLEFTKSDLTTSEGIPNTIIEIYDEDNRLLFTKETDIHGQVIINNLPVGRYYIIEKAANSLYMITNEKVFFEIKENGEIVKANMVNEKIEIPVPKTNTYETVIINSILGIGFIIGIGRMYYERKRAY